MRFTMNPSAYSARPFRVRLLTTALVLSALAVGCQGAAVRGQVDDESESGTPSASALDTPHAPSSPGQTGGAPSAPGDGKVTPPVLPDVPRCRDDLQCGRLLRVSSCELAKCIRGTCAAVALADGLACKGSGACVGEGVCVDGSCDAPPLDCDDGNPCTADRCRAGEGCTHAPSNRPCDDGDGCTVGDMCQAGACQPGAPLECDDGDPCTGEEWCDGATGECRSTAAPQCGDGHLDPQCDEACDDGNSANGDGCDEDCHIEDPPCAADGDCDDANPCTIDVCDGWNGCSHADADGAACDDGNACTGGDVCDAGQCAGAPLSCDDGVACTTDSCVPGVGCAHQPQPSACSGGGACAVALCDKYEGCQVLPLSDDTACDDGNACTANDSCQSGVCQGGAAVSCDDGSPCTADTCQPATGCAHAGLNGVECDDGDPCTVADSCKLGQCEAGYETQAPGCGELPGEAICSVSGAAGATVDCPLNVVATDAASIKATAMQLTLEFDADQILLDQLYDWVCFAGAGCFDLPVGGSGTGTFALSTGHAIVMAPMTIGPWNGIACTADTECGATACAAGRCQGSGGFGAMLLLNFSQPDKPVSAAHLQDGVVVGDAEVLRVRFHLTGDIAPDSPVMVIAGAMSGADKDSNAVPIHVENGYLITGE